MTRCNVVDWGARAGALVLALVGLASCDENTLSGPGLEVAAPEMIGAQPVSPSVMAVEWRSVPEAAGYVVERRRDLEGDFEHLARLGVPRDATDTLTSYLDIGLEPETFYGYRVRALGELGGQSPFGIVVGAMTAPPPGINVDVATAGLPPDEFGYLLRIEGLGGVEEVAVGANGTFLVSPLEPGSYVLSLDALPQGCSVDGIPEKEVLVPATGLETRVDVQFRVSCVDPTLGNVVVQVLTVGDTLPGEPYRVELTGIQDGEAVTDSLPVPARLSPGATVAFRNLQPGDYETFLTRVGSPCEVQGDDRVSGILVRPLATDTISYSVACRKPVVLEGVVIRGTWKDAGGNEVSTVVPGSTVRLEITADVADTLDLSAFQATMSWDASLLQAIAAGDVDVGPTDNLDQFTSNLVTAQPGALNFQTFSLTGAPNSGLQGIAAIDFDVLGTGTVLASLDVQVAANLSSEELVRSVLIPDLRIDAVGGTLPPRSDPGGPYGGEVAEVISFDGRGSSDPDGGGIVKYVWDFGDGVRDSISGAQPGHAYGAEGTYTVTLTVEDDEGERGSGTTTATVTAATASANLVGRWIDGAGAPLNGAAAQVGDEVGLVLCASGTALASIEGSLRFEGDLLTLQSASDFDAGSTTVAACSGGDDAFTTFGWDGPGLNPVSWRNGLASGATPGTGPQGIATFTFRVVAEGEGEAEVNLMVTGLDANGTALEFSRDLETLQIEATPGAFADAGGPYSGRIGSPIAFDAGRSTASPGAAITAYEWDFGDGSSETTSTPSTSHVYGQTGSFTVTLTVRDSNGESAVDSAPVTVRPDSGGGPLGWESAFTESSVASGGPVVLVASTRPDVPFRGVRARIGFDPALLRFDSATVSTALSFPAPIVDASLPGVVEVGGSSRTTLDGSVVREVARLFFTAIGPPGTTATSSSELTLIQNENAVPILDLSPFEVLDSSVDIVAAPGAAASR